MSKKFIYLLPLLFCFIFQGCVKDKVMMTYTIWTPVYKDKAEVYANIKSNTPAAVKQPGKLFLYGNYIFLNEVDKGVHIIDNSNPASPLVKAFINIPGNVDIAVKGNTLYADLYSDLVVVDITDPLQARFVKYIPRIFPERSYVNGFIADSSRVIVDWKRKDTTVRLNTYPYCNRCEYAMLSSSQSNNGGPMMNAAPVNGMAGSMARFAVVNNFLYTVNLQKLTSFNISSTMDPLQTSSKPIGWNIETIYPFQNKLFIGSATGIFIYDISNPSNPTAQGQFSHMRVCDPVIADANYAYSTLRSSTTCGGNINQLDVINISNINAPTLVKSYQLSSPYGLSKDNNILFVCDGEAGLRMFDATNPVAIVEKKRLTNVNAYDVIAYNGNLILVAKDGLYQYSYSAPDNLTLKSKLSVNR